MQYQCNFIFAAWAYLGGIFSRRWVQVKYEDGSWFCLGISLSPADL